MIPLTVVIIWIFAPVAWSTSNAKGTYTCDATDNFGCSNWNIKDGQTNRLDCSESEDIKGIMSWAMRPVRSDAYSVRTGNGDPSQDPTTYIPNEYINIFIEVNLYGWKYRGLLLHAINDANHTVGEFVIPQDDNALFWVPPQCPQAAMHTSADPKPYSVRLRFQTPDVGTGRITFRCLLKKGPANHGYFYYPMLNGDLSLTETTNPSTVRTWSIASDKQSCTAFCSNQGQRCDSGALAAMVGPTIFTREIESHFACNQPLMSGCSEYAPTTGSQKLCWYHDDNCDSSRNPQASTCDGISEREEDGMRFCACNNFSEYAPTTGFINADSQLRSSNFWIGFSFLTSLYTKANHQRTTLFVLTAIIFLSFLDVCHAHNWIVTPGRNWGKGSTMKPCPVRKATDTHVQIGPGQTFPILFASGHLRDWHYITVVSGQNSHWLQNSKYFDFVEEYINDAPTTAFQARDTDQRYHWTSISDMPKHHAGGLEFTPSGGWFEKEVTNDDPLYINHPDAPGGVNWKKIHTGDKSKWKLFKYNATKINTDVRVSYKSEKFPWLESAFKFSQHYSLPIDYNVINMTIPARSGIGHYIVHWYWSGYSDCTDVDVRNEPVTHIYGQGTGKFIYNKIDHCSYINPIIKSPCIQAVENVSECVSALKNQRHTSGTDRVGIMVSPLKLPNTVYPRFRNEMQIPWGDPVCGSHTWTTLNGKDTRSTINWVKFESTITKYSEKICETSSATVELTFMEAIAWCSDSTCTGVSWNQVGTENLPSDKENKKFTFKMCTSFSTIQDTTWTTIMKAIPSPTPDNTPFTLNVNFQRSNTADLNLGSGWAIDEGGVYGSDVSTLGWTCTTGVPKMFRYDDSKELTGVNQNTDRCVWEVSVPKGVYQVSTYHKIYYPGQQKNDVRLGACHIEHVKLIPAFSVVGPPGQKITNVIEVTDGKLTWGELPNTENNICENLSYMEITKTGPELKPAWFPSSSNPWWQREFARKEPIGNVYITPPDHNYCSEWWFYGGDRCSSQRVWGKFTAADEGVIVGVSNNSCFGDTCSGVVCGRLDTAPNGTPDGNAALPRKKFHVSCDGVVGKYVYVQFPGNKRIMPPSKLGYFDIEIKRREPDLADDVMVCYAVQAPTLPFDARTSFEYETTQDPLDPMFYSTCYVREKDVKFLGVQNPPPDRRWRFHQHCLDCHNWNKNLAKTNLSVVRWDVAEKCQHCEIN